MKQWFTPPSYTYPNMPWADPSLVNAGLVTPDPIGTKYLNVSGTWIPKHAGTGITSNFLDESLSDGTPKVKSLSLWVVYRRKEIKLVYDRNVHSHGFIANRFRSVPEITAESSDAEKERAQRSGQVPFSNVENYFYTSGGRPVIISSPLFYSSEPQALSQSINTIRGTPSGVGVNLYRTKDSYETNAAEISPELVTTDTWDRYSSHYAGELDIEPVTGITLTGAMVTQFSSFTLNCNPALDASCGLFSSSNDGTKCYQASNIQFPCGAANIFTPNVMGGKILPTFWLIARPPPPQFVINRLEEASSTRYLLSLLVVVIPVVVIVLIITLTALAYYQRRSSNIHSIAVRADEEGAAASEVIAAKTTENHNVVEVADDAVVEFL